MPFCESTGSMVKCLFISWSVTLQLAPLNPQALVGLAIAFGQEGIEAEEVFPLIQGRQWRILVEDMVFDGLKFQRIRMIFFRFVSIRSQRLPGMCIRADLQSGSCSRVIQCTVLIKNPILSTQGFLFVPLNTHLVSFLVRASSVAIRIGNSKSLIGGYCMRLSGAGQVGRGPA